MRGTMMDFPLTLCTILERAGKFFPRVEIVSRKPDRSIMRSTYGDFYRRARRLADALTKLGLKQGDRVASMMWNHSSHLEAFFGVPCAGGILHTLNLRLLPHEIATIAKHAGDRFLLIDDVLLPIYEKFREEFPFDRVIVVPYGAEDVPAGYLNYERLLGEARDDFRYPKIGEDDGAVMCFTSGTTGAAKGVIYSHRALVLHTFACGLHEVSGVSYDDTVMPIVPMYHAHAWGLPLVAVMLGPRLVLPGLHFDAVSVLDLMAGEGITLATSVPTIWIGVLEALEKNPGRWTFERPVRVGAGGSAPPIELIRRLDRFGLRIKHFWGMTECSPLGIAGGLLPHMHDWPEDKQYEARAKQGRPVPFVEIRLMGADGKAPWDGITSGEIEVRGPWVAASYYEASEQADRWTEDGWFRTGDVATMDADGYVKIVDRAKDLVKSGGEWISSVDLENALMGHPAVKEACVIGVPHPKWLERPLAAIVLKDGVKATAQDLRGFLSDSFSKWQLPDAFVFIDAIPRTSVGKFKKSALREQFADWTWDT
jgi:acyl-CoA synthetase (AMP-forming)/AMP-acid ligase II